MMTAPARRRFGRDSDFQDTRLWPGQDDELAFIFPAETARVRVRLPVSTLLAAGRPDQELAGQGLGHSERDMACPAVAILAAPRGPADPAQLLTTTKGTKNTKSSSRNRSEVHRLCSFVLFVSFVVF